MFKLLYRQTTMLLTQAQCFALLFTRVVVAYGFFTPAINKWSNIDATAEWLGSMGFPFPMLNTYLVATTEIVGVVLLALGLFTRLISLPLIVVMVVAITTVHLPNGFEAANNGFEIPLYYMLFLMVLASFGAGRLSLDYLIFGEDQ